MLRACVLVVFGVLVISVPVRPQSELTLSVVGRGLLTTSSKIYPNPDSPSFDLRTINTPFTSVLGGALEVHVSQFNASWFLYFSAEYLSQVKSEMKLDGSLNPPRRVPVDEGYQIIPLEVGGHLYVPLGSQTWRLSMGGGLGAYYTRRVLSIAGVEARSVGNSFGFGIHVSVGTEYVLMPGLAATIGVKFRDPEVDVHNEFQQTSVVYENGVIVFPKGKIPSRVNVDGMTLSAGIRLEIL